MIPAEALPLLWTVYKQFALPSLRDPLLRAYLPWTRKIAERLARQLPASVEVDDLVSLGVVGLIDAIDAYDLAQRKRFEHFAHRRVKGAMLDGLREIDPADRKTRAMLRKLERVSDAIRVQYGRPATAEELAGELSLRPKQLRQLEMRRMALSSRSLSGGGGGGEHDRDRDNAAPGVPANATRDARAIDPARAAFARSLRDALVRHLSREERLVVLLYYCEDLKMHEIGKVLGLSEARVSQIHKNIMLRLRARATDRGDYRALACA